MLLAPFLNDGWSLADAESLRRGNSHLAALVQGQADRLFGMVVVDPLHPTAPADLRRALDQGLRVVKMVPSGRYPYDDAVQAAFAEAARLRLPILFHSGIFIVGRSGRFCRPSVLEVLRDHSGARVTLAHLGWPWTDEAIAVGLIDRIHGVPDEQAAFRFDLSFGPPPPYRLPSLMLALEVLGPGLLQSGSDCFLPCTGAQIVERRGWLTAPGDANDIAERGADLLEDPALRGRMGPLARQRAVQHFSLDDSVARVAQLLLRVGQPTPVADHARRKPALSSALPSALPSALDTLPARGPARNGAHHAGSRAWAACGHTVCPSQGTSTDPERTYPWPTSTKTPSTP